MISRAWIGGERSLLQGCSLPSQLDETRVEAKRRTKMKEIIAGIYHWRAEHPEIGKQVSSYFVEDGGVLIDPLLPGDGLSWFENRKPREIILSNRYHTRHSVQLREAFGCRIWVNRAGIDLGVELDDPTPYRFGDQLPGGIEALEVDAISPDDTALFIPQAGGMVAFADGLMTDENAELTFVDDELMADTPEEVGRVKAGLLEALSRIASERSFKHLLFAHGNPVIGDGDAKLREFLERAK